MQAAVGDDSVAVGEDLLLRLGLHVGDELKLGGKLFRISGMVVNEPDRLSGNFAAGPRVFLSRAELEETGLLAPGSHATERLLFKMPPPGGGKPVSDGAVADLKARLVELLPQAQITEYRETNPAITQGLDRATSLLSLMSLVALVLGAVVAAGGDGAVVAASLAVHHLLGGACAAAVRLLGLDPIAVAAVQARAGRAAERTAVVATDRAREAIAAQDPSLLPSTGRTSEWVVGA